MTVVLYAEVPAFYAEVERAENPGLADKPVLVGGDPRRRGLLQAATPDAMALGVTPGMTMLDALALCPRGRALRTDMRRYREVANRLRVCFRCLSPRVETVGLAGAFLGTPEGDLTAAEFARALRRAVAEELRLPLRVGIAPARFLAQLAAEEAGPEGVLEVTAGEVAAFLGPLPVSRLPGVGPNTAARLAALGARRVAELASLEVAVVEEALGNHGLTILEYARGRGDARVRDSGPVRSLSQECTLETEERDLAVLDERLLDLARGLEHALQRERAAARRVILKLRYGDVAEATTRSRTGPRGLEGAAEIGAVAAELLRDTQAGQRSVRLVGITLGQLVPSSRDEHQLDLFSRQPG